MVIRAIRNNSVMNVQLLLYFLYSIISGFVKVDGGLLPVLKLHFTYVYCTADQNEIGMHQMPLQ